MGHDTAVAIGTRLRALRAARLLSQRALAEAAGISTQAVECYEAGSRTPGAGAIIALAAALECSADDLLGLGPRTRA